MRTFCRPFKAKATHVTAPNQFTAICCTNMYDFRENLRNKKEKMIYSRDMTTLWSTILVYGE